MKLIESPAERACESAAVYLFDAFVLDLAALELRRHHQPLPIATKSLQVLAHLVRNRDRIVTRSELLQAAWPGVCVASGSLTQAIWEIRGALGERSGQPSMIHTLRGHGYRFIAKVEVRPGAGTPRCTQCDLSEPSCAEEVAVLACWLESRSGRPWPSTLRRRVSGLDKQALMIAVELAGYFTDCQLTVNPGATSSALGAAPAEVRAVKP